MTSEDMRKVAQEEWLTALGFLRIAASLGLVAELARAFGPDWRERYVIY